MDQWLSTLDLDEELLKIEDEMARRSLFQFVETFWSTVESCEFVDGWHLAVICEHLEAVAKGQIRRLVINMPPRHMKSLAVCVFWPAWIWAQNPGVQFLFSTYAASLSIRDSVRMRRLVQSRRFWHLIKDAWPKFCLLGDQNTKIRYDNPYGGYRLATSVDGTNTGEGGDIIAIDDAHNVREAESDKKRASVIEWYDQAMSTRLNDRKKGAIVVVQQRTHQGDLAGHLLEKQHAAGGRWEHLCLPAYYESENRIFTSLDIEDPREEHDELLWPERFDEEAMDEIEEDLTEYGKAGQLQQRPVPREGNMFQVGLIEVVDEIPWGLVRRTRYWDKAGTKDGGAYSSGGLLGELKDGRHIILDVTRGQWDPFARNQRIKQCAEMDGKDVSIWVEQEPGSGGKESALISVRQLAGFKIKRDPVTGDKVTRAEPFADQVNAGNVIMLRGAWNKKLVDELEVWPNSTYKDQGDCLGGAFNKMHLRKKVRALGKRSKIQNAGARKAHR